VRELIAGKHPHADLLAEVERLRQYAARVRSQVGAQGRGTP